MDLRKVFIRAITIPALTNSYISLQSGKVARLIVTGVDQSGFDIVLVDTDHDGRLGRDVDLAVVVGIGLWRGLALEIGDRRGDGILILSPPSL